MEKEDIFEEIMDIGRSRGKLTSVEISDVASEYLSTEEMEELVDLLIDAGVEVTDDEDAEMTEGITEAEDTDSEETVGYEKTEDIVQSYFHSMGNISILTRDEEVELAKGLEDGKEIIAKLVRKLPLCRRLEAGMDQGNGDEPGEPEDERAEKVLEASLKVLGDIMLKIQTEDGKVARYGGLKGLKKVIQEKKKRNINPSHLIALAKEVQSGYREVEAEAGAGVDELKADWERVSKARTLVTAAKNELITRNLRLVINIAKNYVGRGLSLLDLIQEGNIGLMKAVDKFKHEKGFKFSTYATWWIRQRMTRALMDQTKTIRVPVHAVEFYNRATRVSRELRQQLGRDPDKEEIAEKLAVSTGKLEEVLTAIQDPIALQTPLGDDDSKLEDFISDEDSPSPYSDTEKNDITERIIRVLETLEPREAAVVRMRFGIGFEKDYTLEEIGRHFSITRERVRQIEAKALRKLKHPHRKRELRVLVG